MTTETVDQLGMDEIVIEDSEAEAALEERQQLKERLSDVRKEYKTADDEARFAVARHDDELPEGGVVRIGRFRVSKKVRKGRTVSFETEDKVNITIAKADDE